MVTRLYDGMRGLDLPGKAKGPGDSVSQEQFTVSLSHLLKGSSEEKSLVIMKMISATDGPVTAREVQKVPRPRGPLQPPHAALVSPRWGARLRSWRRHGEMPRWGTLVRSGPWTEALVTHSKNTDLLGQVISSRTVAGHSRPCTDTTRFPVLL